MGADFLSRQANQRTVVCMKAKQMAVDASTGATGEVMRVLGVWFWVGLGVLAFIAFAMATAVVMIATLPRTTKEWAVALISTLFSSFGIGITVTLYFGLHQRLMSAHQVEVVMAMIQITSVLFAGGLPGWILVRGLFLWSERRKDRDLAELAAELAKQVKEIKS